MVPRPTAAFGRRVAAIVVLAIVAASAAGVSLATGGPSRTARAVSACGQAGRAVPRPAVVPAAVLPEGARLGSVERMRPHITIVRGAVSGDFRRTVDFFVERLPAAGYRLFDGDAEAFEAESRFAGHGLTGKWKVNAIPGCPGTVRLGLYVKR
jgi:hypothetical protein